MAGTISSAGIGSGLDVATIVSQLMSIEKQPLKQLQTQASTTQSQISEVGKISSALSTLRELSTKLASSTFWAQTTAKSSDAAVSITNDGTAKPATYSVAVSSLASAQAVVGTQRFAATTDTVGSGTLSIALGSWSADGNSFNGRTPASSVDVVIEDGDTLATLRDKINASGGGVTASILTDSTGSRLVMRSKDTGAANGFSVTVAGGSGGVANLGYAPGAKSATLTSSAADSVATIDGIEVRSASKQLTNVLDGVSLTLNAVTTTPVTATVSSDTDAIKKAITDFAAAYTSVATLIANDTKYDAGSKKAGVLQGDSLITGALMRMRSTLGNGTTASTVFARLSDIGLEQQRDGSIKVNDTKLTNAVANVDQLRVAFSNLDSANPSNSGFAKQFQKLADSLIGATGSITQRSTALKDKLERNQDRQDALNDRLARVEARLTAQYGALDTKVSSANALQSYVSQQITQWNKAT
ncbi:flagellar filament capping protein FliD [Piscinibacter sakaiensis]|uniref:Flagellar hook-associated protein 2 n=1 Tax=Piscinibacter sakaiensis TaxID=1547922 RepID=A0A0K8P6S5_PISS1|nr:flagellar filament capping protein FliD [Piscinibacter sakaiensis]GAP38219.1 flagellar hook-associated protein FliD [Piscinibacter sakaiensis]